MEVKVSKTCDGKLIQIKAEGLGSFFVDINEEPFASLVKYDVPELCGGFTFYHWHTIEMDRNVLLSRIHASHRAMDASQLRSAQINATQVAHAEHLNAME